MEPVSLQHSENWIWLPRGRYPDCQQTLPSALLWRLQNYTVAEFRRDYTFEKKVVSAQLRFSADTAFSLYCSDALIATGPPAVGGDFIGNDTPREPFYAFEREVFPNSRELRFFARVRMAPVQIFEYSRGRGGFMLSGIVTFEDGTEARIQTDESWLVRRNGSYQAPRTFDGRIQPDEFVSAQVVENIWNSQIAPIPPREEYIHSFENGTLTLVPGEQKTVRLELSRIYGGFVHLKAQTEGILRCAVTMREDRETGTREEAVFSGPGEYRGDYLHSAGNILVELENESGTMSQITVSFIQTNYPVAQEAAVTVSDDALNAVLSTCRHTLKICRQTHHLDSTRHCEPLACTGDYYIESLMTPFTFGDMSLSKFDVLRTASMLEGHQGRMFHTTYSLIWVRMLWDVYMATGDKTLLAHCREALGLLLKRFETYLGNNGLLETPPDYMFVDWIYIDGFSLHHPPKALGQSCLNMFYFGALEAAEKIYGSLELPRDAGLCRKKRDALGTAINALLYDPEKDCYFEGLNTATPENLLGEYMPPNTPKRYYLKHSNILAACFGVCNRSRGVRILHKVMAEEIPGNCQPYFLHYLLEAVYRHGLREEYTLRILERWKEPVASFSKGLVEGFYPPEPGYVFDHSHAWGGTPAYALPKALMGLEILEPGMKTLRLKPSRLGLAEARAELLTPYGKVAVAMAGEQEPVIQCPEEITLVMD